MRILWVSEEEPDLTGGGGNIRLHHLLDGISRRETVDLLVMDPLRDEALRRRLGRVIELERPPFPAEPEGGWRRRLHDLRIALFARDTFEIRVGRNFRATFAPVLAELVADGDYDVVHFEHAVLAPLLDVVHRAAPARKPVTEITLQNLASLRSSQLAEVAAHWRHRWLWSADARRCRRLEGSLGERFDRVVVVSPDDAAALPYPATVVPNGVDLAAFPVTPLPAEPRMLFSGTLDYEPNADGAVWLCREVLPEVRRQVPEARLSLVGRRPLPPVRALADLDGVDAHFDVPAVQPFVAAARVSTVPPRVGSGTRLKALEAMASGRPLAGTTIGLEGLGLVNGTSAVVEDDPIELARGIVRLLTDDGEAERIRTAASALAADFDWDAICERYVEGLRADVPVRTG